MVASKKILKLIIIIIIIIIIINYKIHKDGSLPKGNRSQLKKLLRTKAGIISATKYSLVLLSKV